MSTHAYTEDQLVEQPAIGLFAALGWQTVSALEETFGAGGTLGRETRGEAVLVVRLHAALRKFNPTLPPEAISNAVDELTRDRSAMSLEAANREVYRLLKEGITVSIPDRDTLATGPSPKEQGGQTTERLRVVDWEHSENNDFLLVSQFSVTGALYTCRPDLVGFVSGLPWVVIELKKPGVPARTLNFINSDAAVPGLSRNQAYTLAILVPPAKLLTKVLRIGGHVQAASRHAPTPNPKPPPHPRPAAAASAVGSDQHQGELSHAHASRCSWLPERPRHRSERTLV